jgi:hypothetical protein
MTDCELSEALEARASEAPAPPADLLARVETRYRRRRRRRAVAGTFTAVLLLALGGWAGLGTLSQRPNHPATPAAQAQPFRIPASLANPPLITDTWPSAIVVDKPLTTSPSGPSRDVLGRLDATHLLVGDQNNLFSYDNDSRTFRTLVTGTGSRVPRATEGIAITPHWIVWAVGDQGNNGFSIFRAPVTGGDRRLVAVVRQPVGVVGYYATDEFVYWSNVRNDGVTRLSMSDGTIGALPGFDNLATDGSAWARTTWRSGAAAAGSATIGSRAPAPSAEPPVYRNLVTGEWRTATKLPDTKSLQCVPAFCLGTLAGDPGQQFVQRLDGSGRSPLGGRVRAARVVSNGDGGLLLLAGKDTSVLDPVTGKLGATPHTSATCGTEVGPSVGTVHGIAIVGWSDKSEKVCSMIPEHWVYLPGPD